MSRYSFRDFDNQFRETQWEREQRWKRTRQKRIAEGRCPICAEPKLACKCTPKKPAEDTP